MQYSHTEAATRSILDGPKLATDRRSPGHDYCAVFGNSTILRSTEHPRYPHKLFRSFRRCRRLFQLPPARPTERPLLQVVVTATAAAEVFRRVVVQRQPPGSGVRGRCLCCFRYCY